jgi:hypothetical protein
MPNSFGRAGSRTIPRCKSKHFDIADKQSLGHLLAALHAFRSNDYSPPECLLRPWESVVVPEGHSLSEPYDLSVISMPPEMYDVNEDSLNGGEGHIGTIKFFADDVSIFLITCA